MPKRKTNKYSRPRKPFDKIRIEEENVLKERYGLKNKKEIWKADAAISRIRNLAKQLIVKPDEEKKSFIEKLKKKGFEVKNLSEVLFLNKEDYLKRRLQTLVFTKKIANTPKQARQFVVHRHISIENKIIDKPSYLVDLEKEAQIKLGLSLKPKETLNNPQLLQEENIKERDINKTGEEP